LKGDFVYARSIARSALLIAATASSAPGQELGDRDAGERLAALHCAQCHGVVDSPSGAAAFSTIASIPSMTAEALNSFLQAPHATMPDVVLSPGDRSDLIAYILSLRP
jgi:mono/diheme cytochrome c family protein